MGSTNSTTYSDHVQIALEAEALRKYNIRVKGYNHIYHGYYFEYLEWCKAMYELDCIPENCRQGPNWNPQYDNWGNQIN
jgi:hypothetical protein